MSQYIDIKVTRNPLNSPKDLTEELENELIEDNDDIDSLEEVESNPDTSFDMVQDEGDLEDQGEEELGEVESPKSTTFPAEEDKAISKGKKQRSKERIEELAREKKKIQEELNQRNELLRSMERKVKELQEKEKVATKSSKEILKDSVEQKIGALKAQLIDAMQEGESDKVIELQDQLFNAKTHLNKVETEILEYQESEKKPLQDPPKIPAKALEWVKEHPEFNTDPIFYSASIAVNNLLIQEGYDPTSSSFYSEVDKRLSPHFPKIFKKGVDNQDGSTVELNTELEDLKSSSNEGTTLKTSNNDFEYKETVSGSTRKPSSSIPSQKNSANSASNKVVLSEQDMALINKWGLDVKKFARLKKELAEKDTDSNYTSIEVLKKN